MSYFTSDESEERPVGFGLGLITGWWVGLAVGGLGGTVLGAGVTGLIVRGLL